MPELPLAGRCAHCGDLIHWEVKYRIHRDGFGAGPEVALCVDCGGPDGPTCEQIWTGTRRESDEEFLETWLCGAGK